MDRPDAEPSDDPTLRAALDACLEALAEHQSGLLSDDELRHALFAAGLVQRGDEVLLLDLESGSWRRYDGITISELPSVVRSSDVARWKTAIRSLQPDGGPR